MIDYQAKMVYNPIRVVIKLMVPGFLYCPGAFLKGERVEDEK